MGNILFPISFASFLVIIYESLVNNPIYFIPLWNVWYILGDITIVILNNLITDPGSGNARQMEMIALGWNLEVLLFHQEENCLSVYCFSHKMHGEDRASLLLICSSHSCTLWFLQQDFLSSQPQFQQVPVSKLVKIQRCIHSFTHPFTTIIAITIKLLQSHFPRSICGINTLSGAQWFIHASQKWVSCGRDYSMIDFTLFEWLGCWWWMQKGASML